MFRKVRPFHAFGLSSLAVYPTRIISSLNLMLVLLQDLISYELHLQYNQMQIKLIHVYANTVHTNFTHAPIDAKVAKLIKNYL